MEEIWKDIKGYEGKYQVSNLGNVRSVDRFVLSTSGRNRFFAGRDIPKRKEDFGYTIVSLSDRTTKRKKSSSSCCRGIFAKSRQFTMR